MIGKGVVILIYKKSTKHKTITADNGFDFDTKLNAFTDKLDEQRVEYEVQTNPVAGFIAFITYKVVREIPENKKDEHEMVGDRFYCGSCPKIAQSTDGRFKNLRCSLDGKLKHIEETPCCNAFYEWMESGEWKEGSNTDE